MDDVFTRSPLHQGFGKQTCKAAAGMLAMVTFGVADLSRALRWKEQMLEVDLLVRVRMYSCFWCGHTHVRTKMQLEVFLLGRVWLADPLSLSLELLSAGHDLLVTPTRAAMNDIFEPDIAESRSAASAGVAQVLALCCSALLPRTLAFISVAGVVACATFLQLVASGDTGIILPEGPGLNAAQEDENESPLVLKGSKSTYPYGFWQMWVLQFAGWLSVCTWDVYFSSVWAQVLQTHPGTPAFDSAVHQGTEWLLFGSIVFMAAGAFLTELSAPTGLLGGEIMSMCVAVAAMAVTLTAVCLAHVSLPARYLAIVLVVFAMPVSYQILANTPFAWLERQAGFDAKSRGTLTGVFNQAMSAAQSATAVLSGPLTAACGGQLWSAYAAVVVVDVALLAFLTLGHWRRRFSLPLANDVNAHASYRAMD